MKKRYLILSVFIFIVIIFIAILFLTKNTAPSMPASSWTFESIDTMKFSRDLSREKVTDPLFKKVINQQVKDIAATGATHVAVATPYDEEFFPYLKLWVEAARANNLKVWFRGNWSGWESWFDYPKISREEHLQKTHEFIINHPDLFEDGDVFSACPECENGGPGDPRNNGDVKGHRKFLIDEYNQTRADFKRINKNVTSNYDSMNYDVATLVMDKETTKALGGVVTVDHYVASPEKYASDMKDLAESSGGYIVIGEIGAPIPDIHGNLTPAQQAKWLRDTLSSLSQQPKIIGINYWTNIGGTTEIWNKHNQPKPAQKVLQSFYQLK